MPNNIPNTDIVTKLAVETVINLCKFLETFYNSKFATSNNPSSMYQKQPQNVPNGYYLLK